MIITRFWYGTLALLAAAAAPAATITVVSADGAGEGFNSAAAPPAGAGCNAGETLGQCRLRVFNTAATQWGALLQSSVTIVVSAKMDPQECTPTGAVLGSAGPASAFANFPNAPKPNVAYVVALANSLAGSDLNGATQEINATFNSDIDAACLGNTPGWWYGTNPAVPPQNNRMPLLPVVFHEIAHGLGFSSLYRATDGALITGTSHPIWGYHMYDLSTSQRWKDMTDAQRLTSSKNDPNLVWTGRLSNRWTKNFLTAGRQGGCIRLHAPATLVPGSSVSHWSTATTPNLLMEPSLNTTIFDKVDLTLPLFQDIGWKTGVEDRLFVDGFGAEPCPLESF